VPIAQVEARPATGSQPSEAVVSRPLKVVPAGTLHDVMRGAARIEIPCLDHGFVALVDAMPRLIPEGQTADSAIVQAARVSYGAGTKQVHEDRGLIRYLLRHRHTTPFEMVEFKFHIAMPIFIARQWIRHRTANVNEYSARYSILPDRFYRPSLEAVRKQSKSNRQGGEETFVSAAGKAAGTAGGTGVSPVPDPPSGTSPAPDEATQTAQDFLAFLDRSEALYKDYTALTNAGVSRELARMGLPVSVYTEWYWKCDLHNILRFLSLRMDKHAQLEIRIFAQAMHDLIASIVPITMEAWRDYEFEALHLTRLEIDALSQSLRAGGSMQPIATDNKREQAEWQDKAVRLGFSPE
jgi:thymidylate synthase (FAD)